MKELIAEVDKAIAATKNWVDKGWKMTFGVDNVEVNSLKAAQELPKNFVYKIEAEAYWSNVKTASKEAQEWGLKAKAALEKNDISLAEDCIYYALFLEKPLRGEIADTWLDVYKKARALKAA